MKKLALILFCLSTNLWASLSLEINYSQAVDVFEILDNVSMWNQNCIKSYREYWINSIGLNQKDKNLLDKYVEIRKKYANDKISQERLDLLFSPSVSQYDIGIDAISDAFYSSKSVDDAIKTLQKRLTLEEVKFFVVFYKHFKPAVESLLRDSVLIESMVKKIRDSHFKGKFDSIATSAGTFYDLPSNERINLKVFFVWFPPEKILLMNHIGTNSFVRLNPMVHADKLDPYFVTVEIARRIGMLQSSAQKEAISKRIMDACLDIQYNDRINLLERPLALLFGKVMIEEKITKKNLLYKDWDLDSITNLKTIMIYPALSDAIKSKKTIKDQFLDDSIFLCKILKQTSIVRPASENNPIN